MTRRNPRAAASLFDPGAFRALGHKIVDLLASHLEGCLGGEGPVLRWREPQEAIASVPAVAERGDPDSLVSLAGRLLAESNRLHHPGFIGHQVAPPLPAAALLEAVSALLNNGMAVYEMGPLQTAMEQRVVEWMCERIGFGAGADGVLTSGGSMGNLTALLAARARLDPEAWRDGMADGCVLVSEQAHYCIDRAARILGLGEAGVVKVPVDGEFRMRADALPAALAHARRRGRRVIAVVASACSTATGSFDPLDEVADFCERNGLWMHVDGAHGASFCLSARRRSLLEGIARADSVVWDAHKMLWMPALSTGVLFADGRNSHAPFAQDASYLFARDSRPHDRGTRTLECTKRAIGAVLYGSLALVGERSLAEMLDRTADLAAEFAAEIDRREDFELACRPEANIVCFRHIPSDARDLDAHQAKLRDLALRDGRWYLVRTTLPRGIFLRTTLMNPLTTIEDLRAMLDALRAFA
ncbi:MAG: lysine decarboxylase DesA [Planctomycetota bacterium]